MVATSLYMIVFRILHITAGVAWGGAVFLFVFYVQPTAAALGPAAGPFIAEMVGRRRLVDGILAVAGTTVGAGLFLYWRDWQASGSLGDFVGSGFGLSLTVGAIAAIVAFLFGLFGTKPGIDRLMRLSREAAQAEGPPPPELAARIGALQARLKVLARLSLGLIVLAVLAMATARYWQG